MIKSVNTPAINTKDHSPDQGVLVFDLPMNSTLSNIEQGVEVVLSPKEPKALELFKAEVNAALLERLQSAEEVSSSDIAKFLEAVKTLTNKTINSPGGQLACAKTAAGFLVGTFGIAGFMTAPGAACVGGTIAAVVILNDLWDVHQSPKSSQHKTQESVEPGGKIFEGASNCVIADGVSHVVEGFVVSAAESVGLPPGTAEVIAGLAEKVTELSTEQSLEHIDEAKTKTAISIGRELSRSTQASKQPVSVFTLNRSQF